MGNSGENTEKIGYCTGPVCGGLGLCFDVLSELCRFVEPEQVREEPCMGLCDQGGAFQIKGCSYAGDDLDRLEEILDLDRKN